MFERIGGRARDYWVIGFTPAGEAGAGDEYRRVTVRVARPGARVSTRTGYALGGADGAAQGRREAIDAALAAPFARQGLRVGYTTYVLRGTEPGAASVVLSLEADLPVAEARADAADVVFVVRDARTGQVFASGADVMALPAASSRGEVARAGHRVRFEAPPGIHLMRVVVREPGGRVGSADRQLRIGAVDGSRVSAGDLVLGPPADRFPVRATAFADDGLSGTLELYGPPAALQGVGVELALLSLGDGVAGTRIRSGALDVVDGGSADRRIVRVELPLHGLPAGRYAAQVEVTHGGGAFQVRREIDLAAGSRPGSALTLNPAAAGTAAEVLGGELAARYLATLASAAADGRALEALALARRGDWSAVRARVAAGVADGEAGLVGPALRGLALFAAGDRAGAAAALDAAFDADAEAPRRALTAFFLGWSYASMNDDGGAASAWRRAVFLDPALVPAYLAMADAYVRLSQPALAAQVLRAGLSALPDAPELRDRLSRLPR